MKFNKLKDFANIKITINIAVSYFEGDIFF